MKKYGKFVISIIIGGVFLWLAFRSVDLNEVLESMSKMSYGWIPFYFVAVIFAHYFRAERWRLLFDRSEYKQLPGRRSLFNGVMLGYLVNYAIPRLGEVSRAVYITKKEGGSNSKVLGAIFLERFVDLFVLIFLLAFISIYMIADPTTLRSLFGNETIELLKLAREPVNYVYGLLVVIGLGFLAFGTHLLLKKTGNHINIVKTMYDKILDISRLFLDGLFSLRKVPNWPMFILTTLLIWVGYTLLAYIPFYGFDLVSQYQLGMKEAVIIMVVSTIGVVLPSPGGVGTYHWFVGQTMIVVFMLPPALSMAYAFVTHAVMFFVIVLVTPLSLLLLENVSPVKMMQKLYRNVS